LVFLELFQSFSRAQLGHNAIGRLLGRRGWSIFIEDIVLAVGIRKPPAVIYVLDVPYIDCQHCVHLCWQSA
jgi:hypothetical protein